MPFTICRSSPHGTPAAFETSQTIVAEGEFLSSTSDDWKAQTRHPFVPPASMIDGITLLTLSNGHYSLEFVPSDMRSVAAAIRNRYGLRERRDYPASTDYIFGGCHFIFQNEWDDPCLIA